MVAYPDAKIILTIRDPVKWYHSVKSTIYTSRALGNDPLSRLFSKFLGIWGQLDCSLQVTHGKLT